MCFCGPLGKKNVVPLGASEPHSLRDAASQAFVDEIMQIVEVRFLNESYCVRLAAGGPTTRVPHENRGASQNAVLRDVLVKLHDRSLRFWFISLNRPGQHESVHQQHEAVLAAVKNRDPEGAQDAMRAHIEAFRTNLVKSL